MNTQSGKPSVYRKPGEAIGMAILLGVVFVVLAWIPGERVDPIRPYLRYLQGLAIGYAFGRLHEFLYQRRYHSDPREPKGSGR
jgi:hypothetical protein